MHSGARRYLESIRTKWKGNGPSDRPSREVRQVQGTTGLTYRPLAKNEIRLIRLTKGSLSSDYYELEVQHFDLPTAPPYLALSYVWGDPRKVETILVDDRKLDVTVNLYQALGHIAKLNLLLRMGVMRVLQREYDSLFLWVDAICINQADLDEKSQQVPRMGAIYASAFTTLVWIGTEKQTEDGFLEEPLDFHSLRQYLDSSIHPVEVGCPRIPITPETSSLDITSIKASGAPLAFVGILSTPWFQRCWVSRSMHSMAIGHAMEQGAIKQHSFFLAATSGKTPSDPSKITDHSRILPKPARANRIGGLSYVPPAGPVCFWCRFTSADCTG